MNNSSLTAMLARERRADLLRHAERCRQARDAKGGSRPPSKAAKRLWLAAFCGRTARLLAVSGRIRLGAGTTWFRHRSCPKGDPSVDTNATEPTKRPTPAANPLPEPA